MREKCPNRERYSVPYSVRMRENTDQNKLLIWTLFTQWFILEVNVILQLDSSNKVKGQTKRGLQMNKGTGTGKET